MGMGMGMGMDMLMKMKNPGNKAKRNMPGKDDKSKNY
jgi:hypothetical protein